MAQIKSHKEKKTRKSKVKATLFVAVSTTIFTRIMSLTSPKEIWDYLKNEYVGDERIRGMKVLNLIREFELQKKSPRLSKSTRTDCLALLTSARKISNMYNYLGKHTRSVQDYLGRVVKFFPGIGAKEAYEHCGKTGHPPFKCWKRPDAKCNKCNELGHETVICKNESQNHDADARVADEEEDHLFVSTCISSKVSTNSWLIDSGCTNHMTYDKSLFKELKSTEISKVRIGNGDQILVEGKGTVVIKTSSGNKTILDVLYVQNIDQNLLSICQLIEKGFKVSFDDKHCFINDVARK
ncbi:uncharacterized protein LOC132628757 [Lycium barbarum]|uniref:uncharacterized protein LOC132628757 n=1 Tax=Lycium barbarum TaxID=112863 RepID=UPI00293ECA3D|nr:uncharacterized protein LOC132628757 [Lycium barbarum]